jgi:hypothetical protein
LVWIEDNCIFSHAGISQGWAKRVWKSFEYPESEFKSIMDVALAINDIPLTKFNNYVNIISDISHYRGGDMFYGSSEWADLREHIDMKSSITKIVPKGEDGIYQIFGHTQLRQPLINDYWACLDCRKAFIFDTQTHECKDCL